MVSSCRNNGTISQELRYPFTGTVVQFWQESSGALIKFYAGVEGSKTVIKTAHKLRNENPLTHSSSLLLDSNDTAEDLCKSIKALSKLIYEYINNQMGV